MNLLTVCWGRSKATFKGSVAILLINSLLSPAFAQSPDRGSIVRVQEDSARNWVNRYAVVGAIIGLVGHIPGSTTAALCILEVIMAYHVGKIFRGQEFDRGDAWLAVKASALAGVVAVAVKIAILEALSFMPCLGWVIKAIIAGVIVKLFGEFMIGYIESTVPPTKTKSRSPEDALGKVWAYLNPKQCLKSVVIV